MRTAIDEVLARCGGAAARQPLLAVVTAGQLDDELRRHHLVRPFPGVYCRPWDAQAPDVRERAALVSVGAPAVLSHRTAIRRWGLGHGDDDVHVSVPHGRSVRRRAGLVAHRVVRLPQSFLVRGLPTAPRETAVVSSWPLLGHADRRRTAIDAVRTGAVSVRHLRQEIDRHPKLGGRKDLVALIDLLDSGCESELEIWGLLRVFDVPGLRHGRRQVSVAVNGRRYRLDLAYDAERVAVELDGDRYHSTPEQRERDRRRDAALASVGWLTLRFSRQRLHMDVDGCRRETLATLAGRRR